MLPGMENPGSIFFVVPAKGREGYKSKSIEVLYIPNEQFFLKK